MQDKLKVPCAKTELKKIRQFVRDHIKELPISSLEKDRIILAIDEASSNAIIHGNKCDHSKTLKVVITTNPQSIKVKIFDIGDDIFNPVLHYQKDMQELIKNRQKGGMGLKLIHDVMDKVNYYKKNDHRICALTKHISPPHS